jgi:hypothetical protein
MKSVKYDLDTFKHEKYSLETSLIESEQPNTFVLSMKSHIEKTHLTTTLTKADLLLLLEFLSTKGLE